MTDDSCIGPRHKALAHDVYNVPIAGNEPLDPEDDDRLIIRGNKDPFTGISEWSPV